MDSDNLVFQADECRQVPRTDEERCRQERWIFEEESKYSLDSLPQAAESGDAEAQYRLGVVYMEGPACYPEDETRAEYWYERAAAQGHEFARQHLEAMWREAEQDSTDQPDEE